MKSGLYAVALVTLATCTHARAMSFVDRNVDEIFNDATLVMTAQAWAISAECVNEYNCPGYRIELRPSAIIKASTDHPAAESKRIRVCSAIQLEVGHTYTVFLERPRAGFFDDVKECHLVLEKDGAFEDRAGDYYRINSHESDVIFSRFENKYYSNAILSPNFKESIDALAR